METLPPSTQNHLTGSTCLPLPHHAPLLALQEDSKEVLTTATDFPTPCESLTNASPDGLLLKTSQDSCAAQCDLETNGGVTSTGSPSNYTDEDIEASGAFLAVINSDCHISANDCLLLPTPTGLSSSNSRPPGQTKLEVNLKQRGLLVRGQVANPQFLEAMMGTHLEYSSLSNPANQNLFPSESHQKTPSIDKDEKPLATASPSPAPKPSSSEFSTSVVLNEVAIATPTDLIDEVAIATPTDLMDEVEALGIIEEINNTCKKIRFLLVELDSRQGYLALGFSSMNQLLKSNLFGKAKSTLRLELVAGKIEKENLLVPVGTFPESQLRSLPKLKSDYHGEAIALAKNIAGDRPLTANDVSAAVSQIVIDRPETCKKSIVDRIKEKTFIPLPQRSEYQMGDVVIVKPKGSTLRYCDGYWGILERIGENFYHVCISVKNEVVQCKGDELKRVETNEQDRANFKVISDRIKKLAMRDDLATTANAMLEALSRKTCFTDDDLWFLEKIEERYGISQ